jgi:adenylylsulfate kinase-like enzyme
VIIWINGTFGVGKTQVAHELQRRLSVAYRPERSDSGGAGRRTGCSVAILG